MPSSPPTALGGSAFLTLIIQNKNPMECSPWAFTIFFFFFPQLPTLLSMPSSPPTALGGSFSFSFSSIKNKRPMERSPWALKPFTNPNQDVFLIPCLCFCLFRVFPCKSVAMLLLVLPSMANLLFPHLQMNDSRFSCRFRKCIQYP